MTTFDIVLIIYYNFTGFNMKLLKFLIMDEADRILNMDFEAEVDKILRAIPRERKTYLFSATMTAKGKKFGIVIRTMSPQINILTGSCSSWGTLLKLSEICLVLTRWREKCFVLTLVRSHPQEPLRAILRYHQFIHFVHIKLGLIWII